MKSTRCRKVAPGGAPDDPLRRFEAGKEGPEEYGDREASGDRPRKLGQDVRDEPPEWKAVPPQKRACPKQDEQIGPQGLSNQRRAQLGHRVSAFVL
jgi:hypothetical protein